MAKAKRTKKPAVQNTKKPTHNFEASIIILVVIAVILGIFIYTQAVGVVGNAIKTALLGILGISAYILPLMILVVCAYLIKKKDTTRTVIKATYIFLILVCISALSYLFINSGVANVGEAFNQGIHSGGVLGFVVALGFIKLIGSVVTGIILIVLLGILFSLATGISIINSVITFFKGFTGEVKKMKKPDKSKAGQEVAKKIKDGFGVLKTKTFDMPLDEAGDLEDLPNVKISNFEDAKPDEFVPEKIFTPEDLSIDKTDFKKDEDIPEFKRITQEQKEQSDNKTRETEIFSNEKTSILSIEEISDDLIAQYHRPPINLLIKGNKNSIDTRVEIREKSIKLIETLASFGVEAKLLQVSMGPAVTRYEIQPSPGVKVSKVVNLVDDIALNLAATGIRIEAPIPGKSAIGIEIANICVSSVTLREIIETDEFNDSKSMLSVGFGKDIAGKIVIGDIADMPHVLIAGATGSGKSVCINTLITSILYKATPDEVRLIMVDPKVVELGIYNGIPHLLIPVVTDPKKASGALNWAVQEMMRRYALFSEDRVRDLKGYNSLQRAKEMPIVPQIVIIIDELADLMMVAAKEVEDSICRLTQLARAAGIHLVIATQRPSVDVITGLIKANIPSRIAFAVASQIDSRTILDMGGAEKLLGKGDMLFLPRGASKPIRVQGAFVSDKEIEAVVEFIKEKHQDVIYDDEIERRIVEGQSSIAGYDEDEDDELLSQAIEIVMEAGQASASMLQRKFKVGYARAGRMVDQMEKRGIISGFEGSKPRRVLTSRSEIGDWNNE